MDDARTGRPTVLLVEDDPAVRRLQTVALEKAGPFHVLTAAEGQEALDLLRDTSVDAVVTDLRMPGMDGFQLVAEISTRYPGLPVFVLTAIPDQAHLDPALTGGSLNILSKPPDYAALAAQVRGLPPRAQGSVKGLSLPGLLHLLQWEARTATITVHAGKLLGRLYVRDGLLIQAETRDLQGVEAAFAMCAWPAPSVDFVNTCRMPVVFSLSAEALQMELALRRDRDHA